MACCTGKEIDLKELKTPGQKEMGKILGPLLAAGISQGATPFGGQLSQPPDPAQMAAMNMMMGVGGQGQYQPGMYPLMGPSAANRPPGPNIPWNPDYTSKGTDIGDLPGQAGTGTPGDPYRKISKWSLQDPNAPRRTIFGGALQDPYASTPTGGGGICGGRT